MKRIILSITAALITLVLMTGCAGNSGIYKAGTYTAAAKGYRGDITLEVAFDKDELLSIRIIDQEETAGIGDRAIEVLTEKILEAQSAQVDAVTTATVTSDAIKDAVQDCIRQAEKR